MDKLFVIRTLQQPGVQEELAERGALCAGAGAVSGLVTAAVRGYRVPTAAVIGSAGFVLAGVPFFALQRVFQERRQGVQDPWNSVLAGAFVGWFVGLGISGPGRCPQSALTLAALCGAVHWSLSTVGHWRQRTPASSSAAVRNETESFQWPEWLPIQPVRPGYRPPHVELAELVAKRASLEEELRERRARLEHERGAEPASPCDCSPK
jgi:hypothetical protein